MLESRDKYRRGHLSDIKVRKNSLGNISSGVQSLSMNTKKEVLLYVPRNYQHENPSPLIVTLHGAGGTASHGLSYLQHYADSNNIILLAPASRGYSWDIIAGKEFGPDVVLIDEMMSNAFDHYSIDRSHIAIGGFSDGASYALCIGGSNGNLFTHIIAFSPGFYYAPEYRGKPLVFISHGTKDEVLPVDPCSRRIVSKLKGKGISVFYQEFNGEHEIPVAVSKAAVEWFLSK